MRQGTKGRLALHAAAGGVLALLASLVSALAASPVILGASCTPPISGGIATAHATDMTQGILQCIPNRQGQYFWQAMGAGMVLYDTSANCAVAGMLRWNGSALQFCNGSNWQSFGGSGNGKLYWDGDWTGNRYWCNAGYHVAGFHYDCGCQNNATWFECQPN